MKKQACSFPSQSHQLEKDLDSDEKPSSSPKSSLVGLCRRLPSKKNERASLSVIPDAPKCEKFERVFRYFDENGDGKISAAELRSCMRTIGEELSVEESEAVVESIDSDGDGMLGYEDFVRLIEVQGEEEEGNDLREAFGMYEEGSGCITPKSLKKMLSRLGESKTIDECMAMICRFDLNGDGVLSFEEFRVMMV